MYSDYKAEAKIPPNAIAPTKMPFPAKWIKASLSWGDGKVDAPKATKAGPAEGGGRGEGGGKEEGKKGGRVIRRAVFAKLATCFSCLPGHW